MGKLRISRAPAVTAIMAQGHVGSALPINSSTPLAALPTKRGLNKTDTRFDANKEVERMRNGGGVEKGWGGERNEM
ncbi:hypothetical protein RRG08_008610 [Elysia crispata]|uniref:Uncharacterized protein n=1 Tax=Elysia crispata TaxID=231223 RepID=A0AAE1B8L3_9GAST|nr:hypothetical protein RRG08_008610 [Elysia crispata]